MRAASGPPSIVQGNRSRKPATSSRTATPRCSSRSASFSAPSLGVVIQITPLLRSVKPDSDVWRKLRAHGCFGDRVVGDASFLQRSCLLQPCGSERSEEHTSELQSRENLVCRLL